jgi:release factor glutamine methyltransferase
MPRRAYARTVPEAGPGVTLTMRSSVIGRLRAAGCVFAEDEADVLLAATTDPATLDAMVARRATGLPLERVVGWADFCGVRVRVAEGVFVPRARTALLVREAAIAANPATATAANPATATAANPATATAANPATAIAAVADTPRSARPIVVDLCCGSGAIGAALTARVPAIALYAADRDPAAVACARTNLTAPVYQGDLFAALPERLRGRIDVLVANVPYVPSEALALMPAEARLHEPPAALDGGADGLAVLRRVAAGAPGWLAPGGAVLMEVGRAQTAAALRALDAAGLAARATHDAELEATIVIGRQRPEGTRPDKTGQS